MIEYRCYEFVALDRALGEKEVGQLRGMSRRAEVSSTHFWADHYGGGLKTDPTKLCERHFDAALCFTSAPSMQLILRLPRESVDAARLSPYFAAASCSSQVVKDHLVIELRRDFAADRDAFLQRGQLGRLLPLRASLLHGDQSLLYLAWLLGVQTGEISGGRKEPPVPPALRGQSPALTAFIELFELDRDLVDAALEGCVEPEVAPTALRAFVRGLSTREKDRFLARVVLEGGEGVGRDLRRAAHASLQPTGAQRRSAATLRARAQELKYQRSGMAVELAPDEEKKALTAHKRRCSTLRRQGERAWARLGRLIAARRYTDAVELAASLRDAFAGDDEPAFRRNLNAVRKRYSRRHGYLRLAAADTASNES